MSASWVLLCVQRQHLVPLNFYQTVIKQIISAVKKVLRQPTYLTAFGLLVPSIAFLLFLIPVVTIPGNDIALALKAQAATKGYFTLIPIAVLESLLLVMFWYTLRRSHTNKNSLTVVGGSNLGAGSGVLAFLFGSKLCPVCIAAIFGVFGSGATLAVLQYRAWLFAVSLVVLGVSLYLVARKVNEKCEHCQVGRTHR